MITTYTISDVDTDDQQYFLKDNLFSLSSENCKSSASRLQPIQVVVSRGCRVGVVQIIHLINHILNNLEAVTGNRGWRLNLTLYEPISWDVKNSQMVRCK